ncbi:MAG TPA: 4-(cytidine 5'-diphospho)-2-C-methyl-D-erythritol kinase [Alloprevotella sp.]|nr:4-(cytidine 5'-diphospho)-2-C-methyl-D-erythritol kinase [Alloprevotella sp.]
MLCFPCAKINIGLNVVRKRPDGYHDIETVFYPIPLHDNLELRRDNKGTAPYSLQLAGDPVDCLPEENLIVRVFRSLQEEFSLPPSFIHLYKRIPSGAGLGGGSADAAFMIKAVNEEYGLNLSEEEMENRIAPFGADCPFFVRCRPVYATGTGNIMSPLPFSLKGWVLVLVKPSVSVSTREAYANLTPRESKHDLRILLANPVEQWRGTVRNDFEERVFLHHPRIAAIKSTLYDMGAVYAAMSGSGSTVFALFRHRIDEVSEVFDDCFVFQEKLRI